MAADEGQFGDFKSYWAEGRSTVGVGQFARALRGAQAREREVGLEGARLAGEAFALALLFETALQEREAARLVAQAEPEHARRAVGREGARPFD